MKPSALRIERLLAKVEAEFACSARPRRYCFYFDEESEAKAQGLPTRSYPMELSREEWEKKYSPPSRATRDNRRTLGAPVPSFSRKKTCTSRGGGGGGERSGLRGDTGISDPFTTRRPAAQGRQGSAPRYCLGSRVRRWRPSHAQRLRIGRTDHARGDRMP